MAHEHGNEPAWNTVVEPRHHRLRLDRFLRSVRPDLTWRTVERLLGGGAVRVAGRPRSRRYFVKRGERVEIQDGAAGMPGAEAPRAAAPVPIELLRTVHLIAAGKPPGMPTNPVGGRKALLDWAREAQPADLAHPPSPGIVHRLDLDASGVVLLSLSAEGHVRLVSAFRRRALKKKYLALVDGRVDPPGGRIDLPLARSASGRVRPAADGRVAVTEYRLLHTCPRAAASLLEVRPLTGRMHQIRAHLASRGHPILGDPRYGRPRADHGAPRLWLHAFSIELPLPLADFLGAPRVIACGLWEDLFRHGEALGLPGLEEWR